MLRHIRIERPELYRAIMTIVDHLLEPEQPPAKHSRSRRR